MAPQSVADAQVAAAWLKSNRRFSGAWVRLTVGLGFGSGLLLILQAWLLTRTIHAVVFDGKGLADVTIYLWSILGLFSLRALLSWLVEQTAFEAAARVKLGLRDQLLRHLFALGPVRHSLERTGEITAVLSDGIEALEGYYARFLPAMTLMALLPLAILVVVFPLDWLSGLILLLTAPLIPLFMILIGKGTERLNQRQWRKLARLSAHFLDVIQGLTTLKLFNASRREVQNVARIADEYRQSTMAVLRVAFLSSLVLEFFATVSIAVVAVSIGFRLLWGEMDFLYGFFILLLAPEYYLPLRSMGTHYHARMDAIGAAERMLHLLELEAPKPCADPQPLPDLLSAEIRFAGITVEFANGTRALDGVDFSIRPGERLALVGPSGAGKSTLMNLLLGFLRPNTGQLLIDDTPLERIDPAVWREQLAWLPQRPQLFAGSILENIRLGRPDASEDEIKQAARQAHADEFIERLPQGYATQLGEAGAGLSGGQVQRLALARAFLRRSPLLLLDEPTASLDAESERLVQAGLDELALGRTLVVIAHRLNTVRHADRILLLDKGRIVAQGTHDELLQESSLYRRLVADFEAHA